MLASDQRAKFYHDLITQGYNPRHSRIMVGRCFPTPQQARARNARAAKYAKRANGTNGEATGHSEQGGAR